MQNIKTKIVLGSESQAHGRNIKRGVNERTSKNVCSRAAAEGKTSSVVVGVDGEKEKKRKKKISASWARRGG